MIVVLFVFSKEDAHISVTPEDKKLQCHFYITSQYVAFRYAIEITQNGFPINYIRQMQSDTYFTRTVETFNNANIADPKATICVRLRPGYTFRVENDDRLEFGRYNTLPILPQTLECVTSEKIKVRFPEQIENWVVVLRENINEGFDPSHYDGCI